MSPANMKRWLSPDLVNDHIAYLKHDDDITSHDVNSKDYIQSYQTQVMDHISDYERLW